MAGSKQTQTTQQSKSPWAPAQPALNSVLSAAQNYGGTPSLFAPSVSSQTLAGLSGVENWATSPTAQQGFIPGILQGAGTGFGTGNEALQATASGSMINQNPYLDAVLDKSRAKAMEDVAGRFSAVGRFGGNAAFGTALGDALASADTAIRAQNYDIERARQLNAAQVLQQGGIQGAGLAGQLDSSNLAQQQALLQAGQTRDALDTATKQAPLTATQWMSGVASPIAALGGTSEGTTETKTPANVPGMILGGLTTAAGLAGGGGLGGLGGLFGGKQVYSQPGTMANGGWSTTATTPGWFF